MRGDWEPFPPQHPLRRGDPKPAQGATKHHRETLRSESFRHSELAVLKSHEGLLGPRPAADATAAGSGARCPRSRSRGCGCSLLPPSVGAVKGSGPLLSADLAQAPIPDTWLLRLWLGGKRTRSGHGFVELEVPYLRAQDVEPGRWREMGGGRYSRITFPGATV